jgi:hypothetical protein
MSIKMITEQQVVSDSKCPNPVCNGRSRKTTGEKTFTCQKCDLVYSMLPKIPVAEPVYGLISRWRRGQASETNQDIVGLDQQNACFKKVHILAPAMNEISTVRTIFQGKSPLQPSNNKRRKVMYVWTWCSCGHDGMKITTDACPSCGSSRCPNCNVARRDLRSYLTSGCNEKYRIPKAAAPTDQPKRDIIRHSSSRLILSVGAVPSTIVFLYDQYCPVLLFITVPGLYFREYRPDSFLVVYELPIV